MRAGKDWTLVLHLNQAQLGSSQYMAYAAFCISKFNLKTLNVLTSVRDHLEWQQK